MSGFIGKIIDLWNGSDIFRSFIVLVDILLIITLIPLAVRAAGGSDGTTPFLVAIGCVIGYLVLLGRVLKSRI